MTQVILSVPVPSDIVISPLAIPWSIISSMMNEVSPFAFIFLLGYANSDLPLANFKGDAVTFPLFNKSLAVFYFNGDELLLPFGPLSRLYLINLIAYSFVKQSQMPSQATIMKSYSGFNYSFLISGNEET